MNPILQRLFAVFLVMAVLFGALPAAAERPERFGGLPVVLLKGTHHQRGIAHGKALHNKIVDLVDNYLVRDLNPFMFFAMLKKMGPLITSSEGLIAEAKGIVKGAKEAGGGLFRSKYRDDDFTWQEILALNVYVDYIGTACSSVSAWNQATRKSTLKGQTVIARNLDWSVHEALLRNQVLFVHLPEETNEQPFISIGFAGLMGCLSCANKAGLGAFLNLGYGNRSGSFPPEHPVTPAALAFRQAIETRTPEGKGLLDSFIATLTGTKRTGSFIIHAVTPNDGWTEPAAVIELLPDEHKVRRAGDDNAFEAPILVATNHHRNAAPARACSRYTIALADAENHSWQYTPDELWKTLWRMRRDDTMQRMLYVPVTGEFRLSTLTPTGKKLKLKTYKSTDFSPVDSITLDQLFNP